MTGEYAVFNRYDIRGEYPDEVDEAFAERFGRAVGTYARRSGRGKVVVSRDTREQSAAIHGPFVTGVRSTGCAVVDIGVGTTDRLGLAASHYGGVGAMITASHHSWERTGFKLLYEEGYGFSNEDLEEVKQFFLEEAFETGEERFLLDEQHEFDEVYLETLHSFLDDHPAGSGTVVLDCCNGAASRTAPLLFEELGFDVVEVNCGTTGGDVDPEPGESSRQYVRERMEVEGAVMALGFDPDADRVYAFHHELGWVGGNELFFLLGKLTGAERITASIDTSDIIEELDADIDYTRVGDVFVAAQGYEDDADLLGEPNGHFAVTDFCWYNSGILAAALLALHADELAGLLEEVPRYVTKRKVYRASDDAEQKVVMQEAMKYAAKNFEVVSTIDGVKFAGDDFTCLVRPSGTSTKVRVVVNSADRRVAQERVDAVYDAIV